MKKKKKTTNSQLRKKKNKNKKTMNSQPRKKKKKVKSGQSCSWYYLRVPHVCLIKKISLSYELWKLKTVKSCFQFP